MTLLSTAWRTSGATPHNRLTAPSLGGPAQIPHKRKMHQNLAWAVGYNSLALPVAAGVFEPLGFVLRPEVGAISMAGSSIIVALNAVALKRLRLPRRTAQNQTPPPRGVTGDRGGDLPAAGAA